MKKALYLLLILCMLLSPCLAENMEETPEGWIYMGYTYGGITFLVPDDMETLELTLQEQEAGIILVGYTEDFTLQLRCITPETFTWNDLQDMLLNEPTAEVALIGEEKNVLYYINTAPTADSELVGIALNGLDGNMYKISIFTGFYEDYRSDAPVWEIAQTIAASTRQMDFSQWSVPEDVTQ
jgi:hypothetical protein